MFELCPFINADRFTSIALLAQDEYGLYMIKLYLEDNFMILYNNIVKIPKNLWICYIYAKSCVFTGFIYTLNLYV